MEMNYKTDSQIEYKFTRAIKSILGNQFVTKDIHSDLKEATDFLTFQINPIRVAVRLRRFEYIKYKEQFTIRYLRPSGIKTEYHKIMEGLVDYMLYGFVNKNEDKIIDYFIGDLMIFREANPKPYSIKPNNPYDSDLAIFRLEDLPADFVIKRYDASTI